jgi:hypothetical protein
MGTVLARPKDDADRLKKNRDERRELLDGFPGNFDDGDFDELSEVTKPDIQLHVHTGGQATAHDAAAMPPARAKSFSQDALDTVPTTLDTIPKHQRLWALLALLLAAVVAYAVSRGVWGPVK